MPADPTAPAALAVFAAAGDRAGLHSSRLEEEVVGLFDQFRDPYLVTC